VRPTNKTNLAAKSEAEKTREWLRLVEREFSRDGKDGSECGSAVLRARDGGLLSRPPGSRLN
jgi:hypothetical protein